MSNYLVIEIEHNRYARFIPLDKKNRGELNLTTLVDNQKKAEVKIYIVHKGKKQLLHTFSASPLPRQKGGEPRLLLSGTFDGDYRVHLTLKVNGKRWASSDLSIKKYVRSRKPLLLTFTALLLLILGLGLLLLLRGCGPGEDKQQSSREEVAEHTFDSSTSDETDDRSADSSTFGETDEQTADTSTADRQDAGETQTETAEQGLSDDELRQDTSHQDQSAEGEPRQEREEPADLPEDTTLLFEPNRSGITSTAAEKLSRLAEELADHPNAELKITGHCALYGTEKGRIELSQQRAKAVAEFLYREGWSPETPPEVTGVGGKEPLTRDRDRQHVNRRVEISID